MKTAFLTHYGEAIAFASDTPVDTARELYSPLIHLYVQPAPSDRL